MRMKCIVVVLILSMLTSCEPDRHPDFEHMPQDRCRWQNPAGYGLPTKEVGK